MSALEEYQRVSALGGYLPSEEAIIERADAAIAELAALNARRCDGCRDWHEDIRGADIGTCWLGVSSTNSDETTCADFSCNRWAARTEEGSGE